MITIGLLGQKRSGKDTLAKFICNHTDNVDTIKVAEPLKNSILELFPSWGHGIFEDDGLKDKVDERYGVSPRDVAKFFGYELLLLLGEAYPAFEKARGTTHHSKTLIERIEQEQESVDEQHSDTEVMVVTDLRTQNDVDAVRAVGGVVIKITRKATDVVPDETTHATESFIPTFTDYDACFGNDGYFDDLEDFARTIVAAYITKEIDTAGEE